MQDLLIGLTGPGQAATDPSSSGPIWDRLLDQFAALGVTPIGVALVLLLIAQTIVTVRRARRPSNAFAVLENTARRASQEAASRRPASEVARELRLRRAVRGADRLAPRR